MGVTYPDISSYQSGISLAGQTFACIKATEGGGPAYPRYQNPDYFRAVNEARSRGVTLFAYHYLHPGDNPNWPASIVSSVIPLMVDAEDIDLTYDDIAIFIEKYARTGGSVRFLYLPSWRWKVMGSPTLDLPDQVYLISSDYGHGYAAGAPGWEPYGGVAPTILQYTSQGTVNSVYPVDLNYYPGSADELQALIYPISRDNQGYPPYPARDFEILNQQPYMRGGDILMWQKQMAHRGWVITADGIYGPKSRDVCTAFQKDSNQHNWPLTVDGIVGRLTWRASWLRPIS